MPTAAAASDRVITSIFNWSHPRDLTEHSAKEMGLVKAVVIMEGEARRTGEDGKMYSIGTMTKENVIFGGGGLRALALNGQAPVDIDHHKVQLPEAYATKYQLDRNKPIVGHVIDAQFSQTADGKTTIEAIMSIHNKAVYKLIEEGKVVGNSVTDFSRGKNCDDDNSCSFVGSTYRRNSLMLDAAPAMAGTWVAPVTASDIGTTIKPTEHRQILPTTLRLGGETADVSTVFANNDEMSTFLTTHKGISKELASEITETAMSTPGTLSASQMVGMEGNDLQLWWSTRAEHVGKTVEHDTTAELEPTVKTEEKPEQKIESKEDVEKPVKLEKEDVLAWLKENKYQEPQKIEEPQTTPQTAAPETEKVEPAQNEPAKTEPTKEPEAKPDPVNIEVEPPAKEEHSIKYIPGGADPTGTTEDIVRLTGMLGGLRLAHNSFRIPPYEGPARKEALRVRHEITKLANITASHLTKASGKSHVVIVRNHGNMNILARE